LPEGMAASVILVNYFLSKLPSAGPDVQRGLLDAARKELAEARKIYPNAPQLVWSAANVELAQPQVNVPLAVTSAITLATSPSALCVPWIETYRLRQSLSWNIEVAEALLWSYAFGRPNRDLGAMMNWARWLETRGRADEAVKVLAQMEQEFPGE